MYDTVQVLVDSILRLVRKKPDLFRASIRRNAAQLNLNNSTAECDPKNKMTPYEHGDKISRMIKKVSILFYMYNYKLVHIFLAYTSHTNLHRYTEIIL